MTASMSSRSGQPVRTAGHDIAPDQMGESVGLGVRLLVSPAAGRLRHLPPVQFQGGQEWVSAGQAVAMVEQGTVAVSVESPIDAHIAGVLVRDGEPVAAGQPLVWLEEAPRRPVIIDGGRKIG